MITYSNDRLFTFKGVTPLVDKNDKYIVLCFVVALSILRLVFSGCDSPLTAKWPSVIRYYITKHKISSEKKVSKMSESIWYFLWHTFSFGYALKILVKEYGTAEKPGWIRYFVKDLKGIWFFSEDLEHVKNKIASWPMLEITMETRVFMLMCTGFWISCLIFINWETRRTDSMIMKFHHVTTILLLVLSYIYNFHRISMFVIFFHDIPDVLLYLTKVYSYYNRNNDVLLVISFGLYGLSHFVMRFLFLSRYIAYPLLMKFDVFDYSGGTIKYLWDFPGGVICPAAIAVLMVMNAYWLNFIICLFKKVIFNRAEVGKSGKIFMLV
ncbi:uncharacterized protein TOT_020000389 [Theileria orientalis strain Shintoku]|uniref:TLC domain-containing protein n=1 Tax=Theileria orientalis strain Shintoku TaxID=869250 RepID=J4C3B0_THEOR|nr:uncharacterized protein TOT_020000389 [Theileria orientalis strain Shintoku]BAM40126.1 uncharacterized protein TOT_020000389 [Theileria orientalis strain Shintoku]|eukprot:XP_009690427.1 uncharacterized protein TOT_020000389 [Theileria orientalis strain Shintoku]